jgi:hypothetical protein
VAKDKTIKKRLPAKIHKDTLQRAGCMHQRETQEPVPGISMVWGVGNLRSIPLDPTQKINVVTNYNNVIKDDVAIVPTSNCLSSTARSPGNICPALPRPSLAAMARQLFGSPSQQYLNAIVIKTNQAIADTGATSIFIMEGTPVNNLRPLLQPLTINLPDGSKVKLTHMCDITIPGPLLS